MVKSQNVVSVGIFLVELEGFFLRKRSAITNPLFGFSSLIKTKKDT